MKANGRPSMRSATREVWLLLLPTLAVMVAVGVLPLITVFNFSFYDIFTLQQVHWIGLEWYAEIIGSERFRQALCRSLLFAGLALTIQLPLGLAIALLLRRCGRYAVIGLMLVAVPLVVPWNMIPTMWLSLITPGTGMLGGLAEAVGFDYKFTFVHTWILLLAVDTWHWLGLVVIMAYAGLSAIPPAVYQASAIDGASRIATLRYIELPRISGALGIVLLLRTVDSLMIYTEAFGINAGGPRAATTFMSLDLGEDIKAFSYGSAAARAMISFLIVTTIAFVFVKAMQNGRLSGSHPK